MKNLWLALLGSAAVLQLASSRQVAQQFNVGDQKEASPLEIEQDIGAIQEQGEALKQELEVGQEQGQLQERWGGFGFPGFGFGRGFGKKGFHRRRWDDDDGKKGRRRHRRHKDDDDDDDGKKGRRRHRRHRRHRGKK